VADFPATLEPLFAVVSVTENVVPARIFVAVVDVAVTTRLGPAAAMTAGMGASTGINSNPVTVAQIESRDVFRNGGAIFFIGVVPHVIVYDILLKAAAELDPVRLFHYCDVSCDRQLDMNQLDHRT
jgi:hypothetical protein